MDLKDVNVLTFKEGDILVIKLKTNIHDIQRDKLKDQVQRILMAAGVSTEVPIMFLGPDLDIEVLRRE
jgi:hypothetical protein